MRQHGTIDFSVRYPKDGNHTESCTLTGDPRENIPCTISVGDLPHLFSGQLIVTFYVRSPKSTPPHFTVGVLSGFHRIRHLETGTNPITLTFTGYAPESGRVIWVFLKHTHFCLGSFRSEKDNYSYRLPLSEYFLGPGADLPGEFYLSRTIADLAHRYWHVCAYLVQPGYHDGTIANAEASFFVGNHVTVVPEVLRSRAGPS